MRPIILAVDDDPVALRVTVHALSAISGDPEVLQACNGVEAVELANQHRPHVVVMDWDMPVLDGIGATRALHSSPETEDIPILMLTALERDAARIEEALEAGAMDFVSKPVDPLELRARASSAIRIARGTRALQESNEELRKALREVKRLSELLPICSFCNEVRSDDGYWADLQTFLHQRAGTEFSHGICPTCYEQEYPEIWAAEVAEKGEDAVRSGG